MSNPDRIYQCLLDKIADNGDNLDKVIIGLTWTLASYRQHTGLAMSPGTYSRSLPWSGELCRRPLSELANWIRSWNGFEASVAMASINAAINYDSELLQRAQALPGEGKGNLRVFDYFLPRLKNQKVVVVGRYPGMESLQQHAELTVLERHAGQADLPDPACEYVLPEADWVFLSGTSIINKTFPRLAELAEDANLVLMGPSLPWIEELAEFGVDYLAGVRVVDQRLLTATVMEGGGTRIFDSAVEYCLHDFTQQHLQSTKDKIARLVTHRDQLKQQMQNWYQHATTGRFPQTHTLIRLDEELCSLDSRYKRLWDASTSIDK